MIGVVAVAEVSTVTVARVPTANKRHRRVSDVVVVAVQTMATELLADQAEMKEPNLLTSGAPSPQTTILRTTGTRSRGLRLLPMTRTEVKALLPEVEEVTALPFATAVTRKAISPESVLLWVGLAEAVVVP